MRCQYYYLLLYVSYSKLVQRLILIPCTNILFLLTIGHFNIYPDKTLEKSSEFILFIPWVWWLEIYIDCFEPINVYRTSIELFVITNNSLGVFHEIHVSKISLFFLSGIKQNFFQNITRFSTSMEQCPSGWSQVLLECTVDWYSEDNFKPSEYSFGSYYCQILCTTSLISYLELTMHILTFYSGQLKAKSGTNAYISQIGCAIKCAILSIKVTMLQIPIFCGLRQYWQWTKHDWLMQVIKCAMLQPMQV